MTAFFVVSGLILCGCSPSGPDRVRVNGKITFAGGPPPEDGYITFTPSQSAEMGSRRPGGARFEKGDGSFSATTVQPDDGLLPGTYDVRVECWRTLPGDDGTPGVSHVPADFAPPPLTVALDGPNPVEFNLDVPTAR